ncbi:hypothetical protein O8C85_00560 [Aliarcobacter butzleri]|uniref:hypothetical protein n=1 Tax=Aliarcobacter butzleri TaxID=28197 RepID=UPI00263E1D55|nr:hypothetical protein [Aliarcobacter butzleri]MDN5097022.1 hypothetical protein [Aliarcobacter butzleri]
MLASYLALISDKNSEQYSSFTDSSGVILRTIINQGYIKEEAIPSTITANEISLNGKKLLEDSLNPDNLLKQISSEYDLNDEQITQIKAELTNKDWYDKTTTLSKMGMIIVQVVVAIVTAGALSTAIGALANNMASSAIAQTMIKGAITSIVSQLGSALVTSAITGNKLDLDVEKILINSIKAAALAGIVDQIDTNLGYTTEAGETLSYADKVSQQILHGFARASVYGGDIETILANSLGNVAFDYIGHTLYKDMENPIIPVTVTHGILGGALAELAGGDFSQGAIATVTSHLVAEYYLNSKIEALKNGSNSSTLNHDQVMAITDAIGGAIVLATHENVTDKELEIAQNMSHSVVKNNVFPIVIAIESIAAGMTATELTILGGAIASLGAVTVYNIIKENPDNITESLSLAMEQKDFQNNNINNPLILAVSQEKRVKNSRTGEIGYEQDDGSIMVKDRAGDRSHGGSAWKRYKNKKEWESKNPQREGTYDEYGNRLRD